MSKLRRAIVFLSLLTVTPNVAAAATGNVTFNGLVTSACVLTVGTPGTLAANSDFTSLSSGNPSGSAGTISALVTGGAFRVSAIAPNAFTLAPAGGGTSVAFAASYSGTGATEILSTGGATTTLLQSGLTNLLVNLAATKSSGAFNAGNYIAEVLVRCE